MHCVCAFMCYVLVRGGWQARLVCGGWGMLLAACSLCGAGEVGWEQSVLQGVSSAFTAWCSPVVMPNTALSQLFLHHTCAHVYCIYHTCAHVYCIYHTCAHVYCIYHTCAHVYCIYHTCAHVYCIYHTCAHVYCIYHTCAHVYCIYRICPVFLF